MTELRGKENNCYNCLSRGKYSCEQPCVDCLKLMELTRKYSLAFPQVYPLWKSKECEHKWVTKTVICEDCGLIQGDMQ